MSKYIGCDVGGTNIKAGVVDVETGRVSQMKRIPTLAHQGHDEVMRRMAGLFTEMISESGVEREAFKGIGIGVPGVLDLEKGMVLFLPNLPGTWPNVPLSDTISAQLGLPVSILNDVRSITFGEWKFGAGRGAHTIACFAVGTGVGGGLVINDRLHLAGGGTSGELGHQTIDFNGPKCGCGNHGCLEAYASGPAIAAMGLKAVVQGQTTLIREMAGNDLNKISPKLIAQAAGQGDEIALNIFEQAGCYIGVAVGNVVVSLAPDRVVIGGGIAQAGDLLLDPIRRTVTQRVTVTNMEHMKIVPAELGRNAGVIGAAMWANENT